MADDVKDSADSTENVVEKTEDVFVNGDSDTKPEVSNNGTTNELTVPKQPLPRRSSLMNKDGHSKRTPRKKTVSFSSMPTERKIATAQDCLAYMQNGSELIKVRSNSRQYHRYFSLSNDMVEIRWQPTNKKPHKAKIGVASVKEVRQGKTTDALRNKEIAGVYPDECAFSIIFGEDFESMDLIANTADEANIWVTGLTCLINANSKSSSCNLGSATSSSYIFLQNIFNNADPENTGLIPDSEVVRLFKRINDTITTSVISQKIKELQMKRGDGLRSRLNSEEFVALFKEISTRPEIYFLLVR
ncbi:hypothetical protein LOTGIDRAFT_128120 [Lottia gigantea]|uniref:PH domain-containing protein n=1 Tax=Lottia gigantea TaxID=225164 RepID=V4A148_LOTGI|nr:hypothetical protein LOTGIDRAFT_128120 [Lottia gigantea]ESO87011.1 hypothetical protein LOTGIDRAFT_128120 [Lottia gigantea]